MTEIEKAISRAKALEHVRRVMEQTKLQVAWMDQTLDFQNNALAGAHQCLELAEMSLTVDLKMHLAANKLSVGAGSDQEPVIIVSNEGGASLTGKENHV